jgi:predicted ATP-grasp superfamily ATP-dependent carboligase
MRARHATLVVAGISARLMAESAAQGGFRVIALDLFGDRDTRDASLRWMAIGDPATLAIDAHRLRGALAEAARAPGAIGWVAGSGFEAAADLLDAAPAGLPLLGMPATGVRRVRDAGHFFAVLDRIGLMHPPVRRDPPPDPAEWLIKRSAGSGGWQVRAARDEPLPADGYYQRRQPGRPMSALFLADGRDARLVALNRLIVRPIGARPHVYHGAIGPLPDADLRDRVEAALAVLVPAFALQGLASLDFIAQDGTPWILEINPRPSASMALHAHACRLGLMHAHVAALAGRLPAVRTPPRVRGSQIVFADAACAIDADDAAALRRQVHCHDVPAGPARFGPGEPVCSVDAEDEDAASVQRELDARARAVRASLRAIEALSA